MNKNLKQTQGDAALLLSVDPHITRDKRKITRLAIFTNFLRSATKTSFIPDVK